MRLIRLWWLGYLLSDLKRKRLAYEAARDRLEKTAKLWQPYKELFQLQRVSRE